MDSRFFVVPSVVLRAAVLGGVLLPAALTALDLDLIVADAAANDAEMQRLELALANVHLDTELRAINDGLGLTLSGAGGSLIGFGYDLASSTGSVSGGASLSASLPDPLATSLSVSVPLSYGPNPADPDTNIFDVDEVSLSATQLLNQLFERAMVGAQGSSDVSGAVSLVRAEAAIQRRGLAVRREVIAHLRTIVTQRRAAAAAENRANGLRRDIETQRLLQQLESGSHAAARLDADLAAAVRDSTAAMADMQVASGRILEALGDAASSALAGGALGALGLDDLPDLVPSLSSPDPALYQAVLEATLERTRAELAAAEQRVEAIPSISVSASYNIIGESISASASVSLPLTRRSLAVGARQRANDVTAAELAIAEARRGYVRAYDDLQTTRARYDQDLAAAHREVEIALLELGETEAAVAAGVSDSSASDVAGWQVGDAREALLLTVLSGHTLGVDIIELHLVQQVGANR